MRSVLVYFVVVLLSLGTFQSGAAETTSTLVEAKRFFDEHSYQLAVEKYDTVLAGDPSLEEKREALYWKGRAHAELNQSNLATEVFSKLLAEGQTDVWAGRAHWRLERHLFPNASDHTNTSAPLEHLRIADEILTREQPEDLPEFMKSVALGMIRIPLNKEQKKEREYLYSFFDRAMPLLKSDEERVEVLIQKAMQAGYVEQEPAPKEQLAQLRSIVAEFDHTDAAARAQLIIANRFVNIGYLKGAVPEFEKLIRLFPRSEERKQADALIGEIKAEQVHFSLGTSYSPGETVSFLMHARNVEKVRVEAIEFDPVEWLKKERLVQTDPQKISGKVAHEQTIPMEKRSDYLSTTASVELKFDAPGAFLLKASAGNASCYSLLLVTDLMLVSNSNNQNVEFWTVDAKTGRPRTSAEVTFASDPEQEKNWLQTPVMKFTHVVTGKSDENGFSDFKPSKNHYSQCTAIARDGNNFAIMDNQYWNGWQEQRARIKTYVYTDRPAYRPEQKVFWRAILREQTQGELTPSANQKYIVEIVDPKGNRLYQDLDARTNEFGSLSGELQLPEGAALGQYGINIRTEDNQYSANGQFRVEEYKKPEYEVAVSSGETLARLNQDVQATVQATYYFGAPVTEAEVKYTVRRRPHYIPWWWHFGGDAESDLGWFDKPEDGNVNRHNTGGDIVASGTGKTDASGKYIIEFKAQVPDVGQEQSHYYGGMRGWTPPSQLSRTYDFQIEVTVTDKSRRNIDGSDTLVVSDKALQIGVRAQQHLYTPGDLVKAVLRSRNFSDEPVATSGTLYVEKVRWLPQEQKEEITTLTTQRVDIGASGSLISNWRVPQDESGCFRFLFMVDDPFGGQNATYGAFTVASETTTDIFYKYQGVEIVSDKDTYEVGEIARVIILNEHKDAYAWYWIDGGMGNIEKRVLPLPHRTNFVSIPITEAFVPNCMLHIVVVRDKQVIQDSKELVTPPKRKVMTVEVRPTKGQFLPGEEGEVEIIARDFEGKPVRGEFSLSLFDKSILYVAPDTREDIRRFYYGQRRNMQSNVRNSLPIPHEFVRYFPPQTRFLYMSPRQRDFVEGLPDVIIGDWDAGSAVGSSNYYFLDQAPGERSDLAAQDKMYARRGIDSRLPAAMAAVPEGAMKESRSEVAPLALRKAGTVSVGDVWRVKNGSGIESKEELVQPTVRADFRDSMFWSPAVVTDENGRATARVKFPDSLTTWKIVTVGADKTFLVGNDTTETLVKKNLLVRLEAPRFFRERDQVTLSGIVHNYLQTTKTAQMRLSATTQDLTTSGITPSGGDAFDIKSVTVPPNGEARVDWVIDIHKWGDATLRADALTDEESDAVEIKLPILPHGIDKFVAWNGSSTDHDSTSAQFQRTGDDVVITQMVDIPKERILESTKLQLLLSPSLASCVRDAIPYLVDYPYGCVEQTMSRFMPAAIVAASFRDMNIPRDELLEKKLPDVIEQGLARLAAFQHSDGGWGWWKDDGTNDYMTAYVLYGLTVAKQAGVAVDEGMFQRGLTRLDEQTREFRKFRDERSLYWFPYDLHTRMYQVFVLALNGRTNSEALEYLWTRRDSLTPHGLALLARALWHSGRQEDARTVLRNMFNVAVITPENDTARWGLLDNCWYWWQDAVESTAQGLVAHLEIDPQSDMVQRTMKWLVLNRKGNRWKSTKDTGQAVLALCAYMKDRKESTPDMDVEIKIGDGPSRSFRVDADNFWKADMKVLLQGAEVPEGKFPLTISKKGKGTLFYSIYADYFTLEEGITSAGNEIYVERTYEKLLREKVDGTTGTSAVDKYVPIVDGETVLSGDELRVTLKIKSLNDYEYLVFEDAKPAGMEPVQLQSGTTYGGGLCSNMELRDKHVAFFITHLPQGEHSITYNCRAEIPGTFHTMPTIGYAMYAPPLRANANEIVIKVKDK